MKFRNPNSGEILDYIDPMKCYSEFKCEYCPLDIDHNKYHEPCRVVIREHPEEVAKMLGYEILDEGDNP